VARSARLKELQTRVTELRKRSLPAEFNPTGAYSQRIFDRTRGFRLLAHAEIEACLEDLGVATVNAAYNAWSIDGKPRTTLVALMTFNDRNGLGVPPKLQRSGVGDLRQRLLDVRNDYVRWVKTENHGVREKNVLRILLPAGIREHEIDPAWLSTIDTFGSNRGATAHGAGRPQTPPDPAQELETVKTIVDGLIPLDQHLSKLRLE
jgi:hypothetical protein